MFNCLNHALKTYQGLWISLYAPIYDELTLWINLVTLLAAIPTDLIEIIPNPSIWILVTDAFLIIMGRFCFIPYREWQKWRMELIITI